jgi:hypothetical protein
MPSNYKAVRPANSLGGLDWLPLDPKHQGGDF